MARQKDASGRWVTDHGRTHSREYAAWGGMLYRCETATAQQYADYGGRGISVCDRWHDFGAFLADMGEAPAGMTLERRDVNGNYEPSNCRWATPFDQAQNRRNTRRVTIGQDTKSLREWCIQFGVSWSMVASRWCRGWPVDQLFAAPRR
jgi:hypothetical protein